MFEKILLATDDSAQAEEALKYARDLAVRDGAQVVVVRAFRHVPDIIGDAERQERRSRSLGEAEHLAHSAAENLEEAGLDVVVEVLEGPPAETVLRVADGHQCDLIVMGSPGRGDLASRLLGSVSHRVLAHAQIPVAVIRATEDGPTSG
jgi:nucleotide-binding universal stress UspA family protein